MTYRYNVVANRPKRIVKVLSYTLALLAGLLVGFVIAAHVIYWILASSVVAASHG